MGQNLAPQNVNPFLSFKEIPDQRIRNNFKNLTDYFKNQNQFLNFAFFEQVFTQATPSFNLAHNLGYVPQDIVMMNCVGPGIVTVNFGQATSKTINISTTDAVRIRFFLGTYWNFTSSYNFATSDVMVFSGSGSTSSSSSSTSKVIGQSFLPSGVILPFGGMTVPTGWLLCNGALISRTQYANLFSAIGTTWGKGDGATTFSIPDGRGLFLRGAGINGSNADASGTKYQTTLAAFQADQFENHQHIGCWNNGAAPFGDSSTTANALNGSSISSMVLPLTSGANTTNALGLPTRTGNETRPANIGVNFIITT